MEKKLIHFAQISFYKKIMCEEIKVKKALFATDLHRFYKKFC